MTLAKLQNPIKQGFEKATEDLKTVYSANSKYGTSLNKVIRVVEMCWVSCLIICIELPSKSATQRIQRHVTKPFFNQPSNSNASSPRR